MSGPRKVGNLVLLDPCGTERRTRLLIPGGGLILSRYCRSTIPSSLPQHLAAKSRLVVHLEHIDTQVRSAARNPLLHRVPPALGSLMRKPGDQIDVDLIDAGCTNARKLHFALLFCVQSANRSGLAVHKRLHAEADAIHPLPQQFVERLVRKLYRRTLERNLCVAGNIELPAQMLKDLSELLPRQQAWRSTPKVNGIDSLRQRGRNVLRSGARSPNLIAQPVHILLHPFRTEDPRSEVAEGALRLTERNRDVDATSSCHFQQNALTSIVSRRIVSQGVPYIHLAALRN